jgi:uncharacterized protein (DUF1800 family)
MHTAYRSVAALTIAAIAATVEGPRAQATSAAAIPSGQLEVHVLNRIGFGPSPASLAKIRRMGVRAYIDEQLDPARLDDSRLAARLESFTTLNLPTRELAQRYFLPAMAERRERQRQAPADATDAASPARESMSPEMRATMRQERTPILELSQARILRAAYSERQLEEALVDFWFNHFNVFAGKGQVRLYLTEYERDAIRPHVLGRFRDLLGATARSPAMLFYLDNWQSTAAADAPTQARPADPRRARGRAMRPVAAGTQPPRAQGRPRGLNENYARELMELHTLGVDGGYTQRDVQEVARAFTGWTITTPRTGGAYRFEPRFHDDGEKVVLGRRIPAGGGERDGELVLDLLSAHPSTAAFIATKLARRFVADDPPPALVARAAARFTATDGNIREVVRTIVTSPEFSAASAYRAKVKNPFEFVVSSIRAIDLQAGTVTPMVLALRELGMPLYGAQPPTGYADEATAWVNTGALLNRMNFALSLTGGRAADRQRGSQPGAEAPAAAADRLMATALGGDVSDGTRTTVARADSVPQALALVLGSPEFQKR